MAHKRMIRQSFQTPGRSARAALFVEQNGSAASRGLHLLSVLAGDASTHHLALRAVLFIRDCQLIMHGSLTGALSASFLRVTHRFLGHTGAPLAGVLSEEVNAASADIMCAGLS